MEKCKGLVKEKRNEWFVGVWGMVLFGFVGVVVNLGKKEIDIEGSFFVVKVFFDFIDLFFEYFGGVVDIIEDIYIVGIGDSCC